MSTPAVQAIFRPQDKTSALYCKETWLEVKRDAFLAGVLGTQTSRSGLVVGAAVIWRFADRKAEAAERLHHDPPDEYYWSPTRPRRRAFYSQPLRGSTIERRAAVVARLLVDSTAYLEATVRAGERAAGAKAADAGDFFERRRREATRFAAKASEPLVALRSATSSLADALDEEGADGRDQLAHSPQRWSGTFDRYMPPEALATLYRAGIPLEAIRIPVRDLMPFGEPTGAWTTSLRTAGRYSEELGTGLREWESDR